MKRILILLCALALQQAVSAQLNCAGWSERQATLERQCKAGDPQACTTLRELVTARRQVGCDAGSMRGVADGSLNPSNGNADRTATPTIGQVSKVPVQRENAAQCVSCSNTSAPYKKFAFLCRNVCTEPMRIEYSDASGAARHDSIPQKSSKWIAYTSSPNTWTLDDAQPE